MTLLRFLASSALISFASHGNTVLVTVDQTSLPFPGAQLVDGDIVLLTPDGSTRSDSGDLRRAPLKLEWRDDASEGWIAIRHDPFEFADSDVTCYLDPKQRGYHATAVDGRPGVHVNAGQHVELKLIPSGGLRGQVQPVLSPTLGTRSQIVDRVRILPATAPKPFPFRSMGVGPIERFAAVDATGHFDVGHLRPGEHRIELLRGGLILATIEGVTVVPGKTSADPRLAELSLKSHAVCRTITPVGPSGEPASDAFVLATTPIGGATFRPDASTAKGAIEAWLPKEADTLTAVACAPGFSPTPWDPTSGVRTIVLAPLVRCVVSADRTFERDIGSHGFLMRLRRAGTPIELAAVYAREVDFKWNGDGPLALELPGAGRYELEVKVLQRMGSRLGEGPSDRFVGTGSFVEVPSDAGPASLTIPADLLQFDT